MTRVTITTGIENNGTFAPPDSGTLTATPTKSRYIKHTVILPKPQNMKMDNLGRFIINLEPTTLGEWCWKLDYKIPGTSQHTEYVLVPDQETAEWDDLTQVNPDTITPDKTPDPVWWGALRNGLKSATPGPTGPTGPEGPKGKPGERGHTGLRGPTGETGPRGPQGETGPRGATGDRGLQGIQGERGLTGERGPQGNTGERGIQGLQGVKGDTGAKGDKGDTGNPLSAISAPKDFNLNTGGSFYYTITSSDSAAGLNYPYTGFIGTVAGYERGGATSGLQEAWSTSSATTGNNFHRRIRVNSVWQPWRTFASQRVDNTAGRAIYTWDDTWNREQLIYADTGNRNLDPNPEIIDMSANNNAIVISRNGYLVTLTLVLTTNVNSPLSSNGTNLVQSALPVGFRPSKDPTFPSIREAGGQVTTVICQVTKEGIIRFYGIPAGNTNSRMSTTVTFKTNDPWPTTLPGTAAGTIPNA